MRNFNIYDIFKRNGLIHADKDAIVDGDDRLTFKDLLSRVNKLATGLAEHGVVKGDRIAIIAFNNSWFLSLYGAAAAIGAIIVPINWRLSNDEIIHILEDCTPKVLFFDTNHRITVNQIASNSKFTGLTIGLDKIDGEKLCINDLIKNESELACIAEGNDPFSIIYTAAVNGQTKGAVLGHDNIVYGNLQTIATLGLTDKDTYLNMLPMFHITGINLAFSVMHQGGKNVIMEKFNAKNVLELTEKEKVSVLGSFPPILSNIMEEMDKKTYNLLSIAHTLGIDSQENIHAFEEKTKSTFWALYGQTETSGMVTLSPASEKPGSAGRQGLLMKIRIVDQQDMDVSNGQTGEIIVQGPMIFQGFWKYEDENRYTFRKKWHHTGDIGCLDSDGYLWFKGRKPEKELIKPGGENVYPAEVENIILEHKSILEVSVIGVPDSKFGEGIKAVCVLQKGSKLTADELAEFVASRIARYKKPRYVDFVTKLPRKQDGSIDRDKVKELYRQ